MGSKLLKLIAVLAVSLMVFVPLSFAQTTTGDINGAVTDPSNAPIPGASLTLTDQVTGATRKTTSDAQGGFAFLQVPVGTYTITGTKDSFKTVSQKGVEVHVATVTNATLQLPVGAASEVVNVEAAALSLNTENGEVGGTMLSNQVSQLPLNGRNFIELTTLMPGSSVGGGFDNKNKGLLAGVDISFSGAPANANQWQVNGANNNDEGSQRTILIYPSVDAIHNSRFCATATAQSTAALAARRSTSPPRAAATNFTAMATISAATMRSMPQIISSARRRRTAFPAPPLAQRRTFCAATTTASP